MAFLVCIHSQCQWLHRVKIPQNRCVAHKMLKVMETVFLWLVQIKMEVFFKEIIWVLHKLHTNLVRTFQSIILNQERFEVQRYYVDQAYLSQRESFQGRVGSLQRIHMINIRDMVIYKLALLCAQFQIVITNSIHDCF